MAAGKLHPRIDRVLPLEAHRRRDDRHCGSQRARTRRPVSEVMNEDTCNFECGLVDARLRAPLSPARLPLLATFRTSRDVRLKSGMRIKAEVRQPLWIYEFTIRLFDCRLFSVAVGFCSFNACIGSSRGPAR